MKSIIDTITRTLLGAPSAPAVAAPAAPAGAAPLRERDLRRPLQWVPAGIICDHNTGDTTYFFRELANGLDYEEQGPCYTSESERGCHALARAEQLTTNAAAHLAALGLTA